MQTRQIIIVGGGAAGWLTAAFLARILACGQQGGVGITVVEAEDIPIIGVGEGTFPTIKSTLAAIGIEENRFMRESQATFKQGIRFAGWGDGADSYFHPFSAPFNLQGAELLPYWLLGCAPDGFSFVEATAVQQQVVEARRAPKRESDPGYSGALNYAYHFDAGGFAGLLRNVAKELGVRHLLRTVHHVEVDEAGKIAGLDIDVHGRLEADLYIDCTGFRAELIGKALKEPFQACGGLFTDRAVTIQTPYPTPNAPLESCTVSTAKEAGWIWDIGLSARRGVGYVYSSAHSGDDRAEEVLRAHLGPAADRLSARRIRFNAGYRRRQWVGNCVAVGLAAGFFEPLESTGIMLIEIAARLISEVFPWDGAMETPSRLYNQLMVERHDRIVDFLKLHYCLSRRPEEFWRDNVDIGTVSASLRDKLEMWRCRPPSRFDFVGDHETFLPISYQAVLYGMGFKTDMSASGPSYRAKQAARAKFEEIRWMVPQALAGLPDHRDLISKIEGVRQLAPT